MHSGSALASILSVLAAALLSATILQKFKQPTIVGFILGGVLIGPQGLGLVPYQNVELLAEVGIGLLMFTIGLELSIHHLMRVKNIALVGGTVLLVATILICLSLQSVFNWSTQEAIVWGIVTGMSSTVVVLKLLAERGEVGSTYGNVSTGILLFQDVISVPILVFLPLLNINNGLNEAIENPALLLGRFMGVAAIIYTLSRFLVPRFLKFVASTHNKELFSISVLCISLGIAAITSQLGLSLALGAFVAGLTVSESDFGNQAASEILPLKDTFSAIFFVSVGMLLQLTYLVKAWPALVLGLIFIIFLKFTIVFGISLLFRYPVKIGVYIALALAQIGEFGFLILVASQRMNIISEKSYQLMLSYAIVSIILTPYILKLQPRIKKYFTFLNKTAWIARNLHTHMENRKTETEDSSRLQQHVVICGFGPTGEIVMRNMQKHGVPVAIVDLNYRAIQTLKANKQFAVYGDSSSMIVLKAANILEAALLVVTIPDPAAMRTLVQKVKSIRPDLPIVLRVKYMSDRDKLLSLGADEIVWEEQEAGNELARLSLTRLNIAHS